MDKNYEDTMEDPENQNYLDTDIRNKGREYDSDE